MHRPDRIFHVLIAAAAFCSTAVFVALAADPGGDPVRRLHDVESKLEADTKHQADLAKEVEALSSDVASLRTQMIATAAAIQSYEEGLTEIELQLAELDAEAASLKERLARRAEQHSAMMNAMVRFARNPPEAALVLPAAPIDTVRGAIVMRAALTPLEDEIKRDWEDLSRLTALRAKIADEQEDKKTQASNLKSESARLDQLFKRMVSLQERARDESATTAKRLAKLSAEAKDLKDLLGRLKAQHPAPAKGEAAQGETQTAFVKPPTGMKPFTAARGRLAMPARGKIVQSFGQPTGAGLSSKGVTFATRPEARVVAPYDGEVVFAGPFRGYGQLLIIAQGEGYHILLSGLSRIDCAVGQWLLAGEPVGIMGPAKSGDPQLYVELRRNGEPINPLPWIAAHEEKVKG